MPLSPTSTEFKFAEARSPRLRIVTFADTAIEIIVRGYTRTGLIHDRFTTTSTRTTIERIIALTEIPSAVTLLTSASGIQRGQVYAQIYLEFANVPAALLCADYISSSTPVGWPATNIVPSTDGSGAALTINSLAGGLGEEFIYFVPVNTRWLLHAVQYNFECDINEAIRESHIIVKNSASQPIALARPTTTQLASELKSYSYANYAIVPATINNIIAGSLPPIILSKDYQILSTTTALQAGDAYSAIQFQVTQWLSI